MGEKGVGKLSQETPPPREGEPMGVMMMMITIINHNNNDDDDDDINVNTNNDDDDNNNMMMMMMIIMIIIIELKGAIRDFYDVITAPRTVSTTHAQVTRAQSCTNHVQHTERSSRAKCRVPLRTKGQLSY